MQCPIPGLCKARCEAMQIHLVRHISLLYSDFQARQKLRKILNSGFISPFFLYNFRHKIARNLLRQASRIAVLIDFALSDKFIVFRREAETRNSKFGNHRPSTNRTRGFGTAEDFRAEGLRCMALRDSYPTPLCEPETISHTLKTTRVKCGVRS